MNEKLKTLLMPGKKVRIFYGDGNVNNQIRHIRAIVDEEQVVYRVWTHSRGWYYKVEWVLGFEITLKGGYLTKAL